MNRVSFSLPDVGLRELRGKAHVEAGQLVLLLEDSFLGLSSPKTTRILIDPDAVADLRMKRGVLRDRLVLEPKSAELLETIPGEHRVAVEMRVSRRQRRELEGLIEDFDRLYWHT